MGIRRRHSLASKPARVARLYARYICFTVKSAYTKFSMSNESKQTRDEYPKLGEFRYVGVEDPLNLDYLPLVDRSESAETVEIHVELDVIRSGLTRVVYPGQGDAELTREVPY